MNFGGRDTSVILFSPKNFDEAGELVGYLQQESTCVMTLETVPAETARRLLDFLSGIAFALGGKITPVSAKTYFITPQNVDILGAQPQTTEAQTEQQPENSGHYF
jgi:cell division inhibitor SepF